MDANSSWKSGEQQLFSSVLNVFDEEIPAENDQKILELLDEDKCISLKRPDGEDNIDCSIFFNSKDNEFVVLGEKIVDPNVKLITDILIVSEAKNVEAFTGVFQEYYKTFQSSLISDLGDTKIFKTYITFSKPEKSVVLKLKGFPCIDDVWIYGIFVKVQLVGDSIGKYNANKLDCILKDKHVVLSEKAKHFKLLYSTMNNNSQNKFDKAHYKQVLTNIGNNFDCLQISTDVESENCTILKANFEKEQTFDNFFDNRLNHELKDNIASKMQNPTNLELEHIKSANSYLSFIHCKCCRFQERGIPPTIVNVDGSSNHNTGTMPTSQPELKAGGVEETETMQHKENISHLLESLLDVKLREFEMKLKVQFEERNKYIFNKLSAIETLLMEVIKNKQ